MFYLRIIKETRINEDARFEQAIENFELGDSYLILTKGKTMEFDDEMRANYPETETDDIRALLCAKEGKRFFIKTKSALESCDYYIMTEAGQTFERL